MFTRHNVLFFFAFLTCIILLLVLCRDCHRTGNKIIEPHAYLYPLSNYSLRHTAASRNEEPRRRRREVELKSYTMGPYIPGPPPQKIVLKEHIIDRP